MGGSWQAKILKNASTLIIKVGSAVLTGPASLNDSVISSLASQMDFIRDNGSGEPRKIILVSSGAVAAGRAIMARNEGVDSHRSLAKPALAAIGQSHLMRAWSRAFSPAGIVTAQVLLTRDDLRSRKRFQRAAATFAQMLEWNVVPVVNENDTVAANDLKFGDNDCLASLLVNLVEADLFINLTSAPGVYAENPEHNPDAPILGEIPDIASLDIDGMCGSKTESGSGGMRSKLLAARRVSQLGVPTLILPGRKPEVLKRAFMDSHEGTWVCPASKAIPRRKFWLAYQSEPAGSVDIDDGAAQALLHQGGSLLPGGIRGVQGDFDKGALLRVTHAGQNLGVGFSNYSAEDIARIKGLKRHEVAALLGQARYPDVIHRDNLLLDAAI